MLELHGEWFSSFRYLCYRSNSIYKMFNFDFILRRYFSALKVCGITQSSLYDTFKDILSKKGLMPSNKLRLERE